uniref:SZT2 subunit of KICSTOR complex n=1 Tax=Paramormyrops kingsleyae TaxID=1676925 RepID=A0A3B3SQP0_9TELE
MVTELPMQASEDGESHTCIIQYILFPPHSTSTKDSFSTDDDNDTEVEAIDLDTELNLVTECWVEPQTGVVGMASEHQRHLCDLMYQEIPQAIFPRDLACMCTIMTFEYLSQLCQNKDLIYPLCGDKCIQTIPFQFDLIKLLPKCQQIEIVFLTLSREVAHSSPSLPNEVLVSLFHSCMKQDLSDREIPLEDADTGLLSLLRSGSGLQSVSNMGLAEEGAVAEKNETPSPQWKCYAKYVNAHQIFLTFLPATFAGKNEERCWQPAPQSGPGVSVHPARNLHRGEQGLGQPGVEEKDGVQFTEPNKRDLHITFSRQVSQQSAGNLARPRCPIYIYNCSLESLREQLVHPNANRQPRDIFFRYATLLLHLGDISYPISAPLHKELAGYCSLLQEHFHQCYVKGPSLASATCLSQDVLTAMDYCEESLQEIDITSFLQTLCGHVHLFREQHDKAARAGVLGLSRTSATFTIGDDKFLEIGARYFKMVPSNPHYFFYCSPSAKREEERRPSEEVEVSEAELATEDENVSGCCIVTESDTDMEVEYREQADRRFPDNDSVSDSNTVNQEDDSFSILDGDSLLEAEGPQPELPPLFIHLTCSINLKSCHGSMPIETLPTCLGEVISCLENAESLQSVDLSDLSVTLDVFVLTLPLDLEVMSSEFHHNRYASESSVSLNRSPAQPSSYHSDEELMRTLDGLNGVGMDGLVSIRWLLEDEIVSALRHSGAITTVVLQKVAEHICRSDDRPQCHSQEVPLQFVFGPEQSLENFKEVGKGQPYCKLRPSRVQSVVSSQGSLDSDMLGYDGGSSDSECEGPTMDEQEPQCPIMPDFWLIVKICQDKVVVYSHSRYVQHRLSDETKLPEYLKLHQALVRKVGEICRLVNQRLLLQDLHDSHSCNSLLVAESEEDIWKNESMYRQRTANPDDYSAEEIYQPRNYLAATMQFIPGHFACDVVWSTVILIHPRLKMGPNMGVSRAIQALRSVLSAFSVVNRKNMFVYQERSTKSVFYLRLSETPQSGKFSDLEANPLHVSRSVGLARSQEPIYSDELAPLLLGSHSSLEGSRPVGQVDKHILLLVHGVGQAGPEITDELVKVLRKRLDEATLDIITVMLVRNCKLTPDDVEFIQPPGSPATEVMEFTLPPYTLSWIQAVAHYLRQNLLIFLHIPKYTDSNMEHHFKHYFNLSSGLPDSDIYLYNKPGGQGTGGKAQIYLSFTEPQIRVRFDIWEQGNISSLQLADKLQGALRHALCDVIMELRVLPNPLCVEACSFVIKNSPAPITLTPAPGTTPSTGTSTPESTTPTSKTTRRSFWEILSKPDPAELGSPKTTDDIVQERGEDSRAARRRHKTETVKQQWSQEKIVAADMEHAQRRHTSQLEEGETGVLHPVYLSTYQPWVTFMARLGCPSIQQCAAEIASCFLLPSLLVEIVNLVSSLASDTVVKVFETPGEAFVPVTHHPGKPPSTSKHFLLIGRNFHQWRCSTEQAHKGLQRFEALEQSDWFCAGQACKGVAPRQRFLIVYISDKKVTLYMYNWSVDLGASLSRELTRLVQWQNARSHVLHCLLSQKMGLFHHYCLSDPPAHEDLKQENNPFLNSTLEVDALLRSPVPPAPSKDPGRLSGCPRTLPLMHFHPELVPFDEALRDVCIERPMSSGPDGTDAVAQHGAQLLEIKAAERREMEKQMKIENLFVTWQQRSAQSNMPITVTDLETLKQSSRLVHYCATPLLFDPVFRKQIQEGQIFHPQPKKRHRSNESTLSGRSRSYSTDSADAPPGRPPQEAWLQDISSTFLQQYVQYLQSIGFILVQVRPQSPARSIARARAAAFSSMSSEGRASFSCNKQKSEDSPKRSSGLGTSTYHLQRALPGGIVLMELAFQGSYFCVTQYALECSRIPMGQTVNSQLSMLFTEECDKVRDLMHVHSFSYDFHLRVVHQYLVGCHMTLRQGYQLSSFLEDFMAHHPDIPKFGRNHVFQGSFSISTGMITAHQLYNYITDHAGTYDMKPLRMSKTAITTDNKKGTPNADLHEYALVALWNSSGSYKDTEGLRHHDDFDVSLLVCHNAAPFEEQSEGERHCLRLRYYVIMTSQRELFPRLTADMQRFKKLPQIHRELGDLGGKVTQEPQGGGATPVLFCSSPVFPLLNSEVNFARRQIQTCVQQAMGHCRRDNLWRRLFHGEHLALDKLKLSKLTFHELEELLNAVHSRSIGDIDPQLDCFLTMSPAWYQSLIKVLLSRFPQSCRHFVDDSGIHYLAVLNQKFTDCFVLVFLDTQAGKTSLKVVFREPLPSHQQGGSSSPPPQLVSMYHHLESVINTACFNLWTGLL